MARSLTGGTLTEAEQRLLADAAITPLAKAWRDADGDFPFDEKGVEAARLALIGNAPAEILDAVAYSAGEFLFRSKHNAKKALNILQPALAKIEEQGRSPRPQSLLLAADCAERIGEIELQIALLEKGLALRSDDKVSLAQIAVRHAEATVARDGPEKALKTLREAAALFDKAGAVQGRAVTMGKIADILKQRGETDEALRIRRQDMLPAFERLGDVRERAVTMGKIADILGQRGETDEALRIQIEERLPVAERIQDTGSIAHIRFSCARLRIARGGLKQGDVQMILDELAESFTLYQKLQQPDGIAVAGFLLGQALAAIGHVGEALTVLDQSAAAFEQMKQADQAAQVREMQKRIRKGNR